MQYYSGIFMTQNWRGLDDFLDLDEINLKVTTQTFYNSVTDDADVEAWYGSSFSALLFERGVRQVYQTKEVLERLLLINLVACSYCLKGIFQGLYAW